MQSAFQNLFSLRIQSVFRFVEPNSFKLIITLKMENRDELRRQKIKLFKFVVLYFKFKTLSQNLKYYFYLFRIVKPLNSKPYLNVKILKRIEMVLKFETIAFLVVLVFAHFFYPIKRKREREGFFFLSTI